MTDKSRMFKVYPTEYVRGFVPTYCLTEDSAWATLMDMEEQTGVEWAIEFPEWAKRKENALNRLCQMVETMSDKAGAENLMKVVNYIEKYWTAE